MHVRRGDEQAAEAVAAWGKIKKRDRWLPAQSLDPSGWPPLLRASTCMWGAVAGIAAASLALAVLHQTLEAVGKAQKPQGPQPKLPEPGPGFEKRAGAGRAFSSRAWSSRPAPTVPKAAGSARMSPVSAPLPAATAAHCRRHSSAADGKWTAPLWQSESAKEALNKARRVLKRK